MGGIGSGRRYEKHERRTDVELCPAVDLRIIKNHLGSDVLVEQKIFRNNRLIFKLLIDPSDAQDGFITVHYRHQGKHLNQQISLTNMSCHLGGKRSFLMCPECGEQFLLLYLHEGSWACRQCHGLAYRSQRLNARKRHLHALRKIEDKKLRGTPPDEKPYRMKQKKHQEILNDLVLHHQKLNELAKKWSDNLEEKYFSKQPDNKI
jgi:ribosomal protein S27AE